MQFLRLLFCAALFSLPASAEDKAPEPCCVFHYTPDEAQAVITGLRTSHGLAADVGNGLADKAVAQAQAQINATQAYTVAHAPKSEKK